MKLLPVLISLPLIVGLCNPAMAAKRKAHPVVPTDDSAGTGEVSPEEAAAKSVADEHQPAKPPLDFDFFGAQPGAAGQGKPGSELSAEESELADQSRTRRWMLKTHQTLGIATWLALVATVTVGQLNYNQLYGGGGSNKWQTPHRALVISTSALFAATATFALLAPTPYKKPLRLDTGLVHRIAVIGATAGMLTEAVLGWITTHQADAGNPHNLRTMARTHQIVGYTTLGFLTIAGTVWLF
jgi:cytochrome b561